MFVNLQGIKKINTIFQFEKIIIIKKQNNNTDKRHTASSVRENMN